MIWPLASLPSCAGRSSRGARGYCDLASLAKPASMPAQMVDSYWCLRPELSKRLIFHVLDPVQTAENDC
jgi:hypothetical protein